MTIRYIQRIISIYTYLPQLRSSSYFSYSLPFIVADISPPHLRASRHWTTWRCERCRVEPVVEVRDQDIRILVSVCTRQLNRWAACSSRARDVQLGAPNVELRAIDRHRSVQGLHLTSQLRGSVSRLVHPKDLHNTRSWKGDIPGSRQTQGYSAA